MRSFLKGINKDSPFCPQFSSDFDSICVSVCGNKLIERQVYSYKWALGRSDRFHLWQSIKLESRATVHMFCGHTKCIVQWRN
jgi:hypothetical protein